MVHTTTPRRIACLMIAHAIMALPIVLAQSVDSSNATGPAVAKFDAQQTALLETFRQEFVLITPGKGRFPQTFLMGGASEMASPRHTVTFAYDFWVAKYEVPQNLWQLVMGQNPSRWRGARNSVELLTFKEAQSFCERATVMMQKAKLIADDQLIRLPSEAEWEYVARAGTKTRYSFGDDISQLDEYAWSTRNAAGNDPPVGALKPNPWGLYDIHGYLWEWCADHGSDGYTGKPTDGSAWQAAEETGLRVLRGGSWKDGAEKLTSDYRVLAPSNLRDDAVGLRCILANVRVQPPKQK